MKSKLFLSTVACAALLSARAWAAVVAVMPVQGVNLSPGQCDAIGVLFSSAFARETNVAVASPLEARPLLTQGRSASAASAQLGASEFIDLRAVQLESRVTLAGIRYGKEGNEIFRAETWAASLDDMEAATARLARSLAWRQPMAYASYGGGPVGVSSEAASASKAYPKAMGLKTSMAFPWAHNHSFAPMISLQFDGRFGSRDSFIEVGAGAAIPTSSSSNSSDIQMGALYAELGGSTYLSDGPVAPYLGAGISPRIIFTSDGWGDGATCAVYGQAGVTFTRDSRARLYSEFRVSQYLVGLSQNGYYYDSSGQYVSGSGSTLYPTEFSLQLGIGW